MKICKECNQLLDLSKFGKHPNSRAHDINYKSLWKRVNKRGLSIESAIQEALK